MRAIQLVSQNPSTALNRRHKVRHILTRAVVKLAGKSRRDAREVVPALAGRVRLPANTLERRAARLSGGQQQRVAVARAVAGEPRVVVCDEPTSSLDISVQSAILNLLVSMQREQQLSYVFVSHDLRVIRYISDRVAVLYLGRLMEVGPSDRVFFGPNHPYTEALLSSLGSAAGGKAARIRLEGELPSAADMPTGCVFHTRCPRKLGDVCETTVPPLRDFGAEHMVRCHIPEGELRTLQISACAPEVKV